MSGVDEKSKQRNIEDKSKERPEASDAYKRKKHLKKQKEEMQQEIWVESIEEDLADYQLDPKFLHKIKQR